MKINKNKILNVDNEVEKINKSYLYNTFISEAGKDFVIDDANKEIIYTLLLYFSGEKNFNNYNLISNKANLSKGILLYGNCGVGKTMLFDILKRVGLIIYKNTGIKKLLFNNISCGSFVNIFMMTTKQNAMSMNLDNYFKGKKLYIDDLGVEPLCFNNYELMEQILFERHRNNSLTFCTTNMTIEGIKHKYGFRVADRLTEMFNIIEWKGNTRRV